MMQEEPVLCLVVLDDYFARMLECKGVSHWIGSGYLSMLYACSYMLTWQAGINLK
ncbi:hypothetical protein KDK_02240 [Dictyobacter kobayashii]|uniref:Uncharacterized protein n=1 Tax=Dictyobacter kobayashii TaxID=2014872 RepID=A0A402ABF3_9CHLR|nr:hypothetical protein KDK_02240 [Dictyobacter kobayashii]